MRPCLVLLGVITAAAAAAAQEPQQPTFRGGTRTVMVPVSVTSRFGEAVSDLRKDEFELFDNGKLQPLTFFDRQVQPIAGVLLIDGGMPRALDEVVATANEFIVRMMPGDRMRLGSFDDVTWWAREFLTDRDALLEFFDNQFNIRIGGRPEPNSRRPHILWDAMDEAIGFLSSATNVRRVLIVVSNGLDVASRQSFESVRRRAGANDVAIVFAKVGGSPRGVGRMPPDGFERLAQETGGWFTLLDPRAGWSAPFTQIALDLHSQYVLGFTPATPDGRAHKLEVQIKRGGLKIQARRSYVSAESAAK